MHSAPNPAPQVVAVHSSARHDFSKTPQDTIELIAGWGVRGDSHGGVTVQHRSRVAQDPTRPNLRQVHLLQCELFDALRDQGFDVAPGQLGENISTRGIDLLALPEGTELHVGATAVLRLTGLRNPCAQIDRFQRGLMAAVLGRAADGALIRKAGVMSVVLVDGRVRPGDALKLVLPPGAQRALRPV
jgi:MOSC domain